jgi:hypothetical protein
MKQTLSAVNNHRQLVAIEIFRLMPTDSSGARLPGDSYGREASAEIAASQARELDGFYD